MRWFLDGLLTVLGFRPAACLYHHNEPSRRNERPLLWPLTADPLNKSVAPRCVDGVFFCALCGRLFTNVEERW